MGFANVVKGSTLTWVHPFFVWYTVIVTQARLQSGPRFSDNVSGVAVGSAEVSASFVLAGFPAASPARLRSEALPVAEVGWKLAFFCVAVGSHTALAFHPSAPLSCLSWPSLKAFASLNP